MEPYTDRAVSRRTFVRAAAWATPVIAVAATVPSAVASPSMDATALIVVDCSAADRMIVYITNNTSEEMRIYVDIDSNGDGVPDFGDGPPVPAGQTIPLGYGALPDGVYGVRVSTDSGTVLQQDVTIACAPLEASASIVVDCSAADRMIVYITNNTSEEMRIYVDIDSNGDGVPDFGDGPPVPAGQTIPLGYGALPDGVYGVRVSTDSGTVLQQDVTIACAPLEASASIVVDCSAADRMIVYITNNTSEEMRIYVDIDSNGDGVPDFGDGPPVPAGQTIPLGYGALPDGVYGVRVSTDSGTVLQQDVTIACTP